MHCYDPAVGSQNLMPLALLVERLLDGASILVAPPSAAPARRRVGVAVEYRRDHQRRGAEAHHALEMLQCTKTVHAHRDASDAIQSPGSDP